MNNNSDFPNDYPLNEWNYLTNRLALLVRQGQIITDCRMFGRCFCVLKLTVYQAELAKTLPGCEHICFCFSEGALVVNACIQAIYAGVV